MSPVPEPTQGGRVGPGDTEDEELNPPTGLSVGPPLSSSDEEPEQADLNDPYPSGYQPLSQDNDVDEDQDDSEIDYTSLSGLMSALAANGPNVVQEDEETSEVTGEHERIRDIGGTSMLSQTEALTEESDRQRRQELMDDRAAVWNSSPMPDRLVLDGNKVEEIKSVMASFILPQSAIPAWAQNLSDEDWKDQVAGLLSRKMSQ
ncbi:hypothetical protein OTU49_008419 [Cherax quadricarinatus]|uniref:Male-enhanced antigen 1 n=1 Tax=Cherax quadricarinatus TaxID=27406 RepID=A0AAW0WPZ5_CHEQU